MTELHELTTEVVERHDAPGVWAVEAINYAGDGEIYMAVFSGPQAEDRAIEYAEVKYNYRQPTPQARKRNRLG